MNEIGFGLLFTVYLLFSAFLAWHLGGLARKNPETTGALGWSIFTVQVVNLVLSLDVFLPSSRGGFSSGGSLPGLGRMAGHSEGRGLRRGHILAVPGDVVRVGGNRAARGTPPAGHRIPR